MPATTRRYPNEEFARRGDAIFERSVKPKLKAADNGKFAAIDIETGEYELDSSRLEACSRLQARLPEAQPWIVLIGSPYTVRIGGGPKPNRS